MTGAHDFLTTQDMHPEVWIGDVAPACDSDRKNHKSRRRLQDRVLGCWEPLAIMVRPVFVGPVDHLAGAAHHFAESERQYRRAVGRNAIIRKWDDSPLGIT